MSLDGYVNSNRLRNIPKARAATIKRLDVQAETVNRLPAFCVSRMLRQVFVHLFILSQITHTEIRTFFSD